MSNILNPLFTIERLRFLVRADLLITINSSETILPFRGTDDGTYPSLIVVIHVGDLTYQLLLLGKCVEPFNPNYILYEGRIPEDFPITSTFGWTAYLPWWSIRQGSGQAGHYFLQRNTARFLFDHEINQNSLYYNSENSSVCGNLSDSAIYCCSLAHLIP